jgi:hypothetical protein
MGDACRGVDGSEHRGGSLRLTFRGGFHPQERRSFVSGFVPTPAGRCSARRHAPIWSRHQGRPQRGCHEPEAHVLGMGLEFTTSYRPRDDRVL